MSKPSGLDGGQAFKAFIERLIEPASSIPEVARPAARLLSLLLLTLTFFLVLTFPIFLTSHDFRTGIHLELFVLLSLSAAGAYGLSRFRYTAAALVAVAVMSAGILVFVLSDLSSPERVALNLSFLAVPTILSALLLPTEAVFGWAVLHLTVVLLSAFLVPGLKTSPALYSLLPYTVITGLTAVIVAIRRRGDRAAAQDRERILEESQSQLNAMLDNLPDAIYFKDRQSRFLRVSKALVAKHGLQEAGQIIGTSDFDFFSEDHARATFDIEQEIILTGKPVINLETPEIWPDRPPTWASVTKMPFRDSGGRVIGTFGISRDITERKQAEEALREASRRQAEWIGELERHNRETALLNEMSDLIQTCPDVREACQVISELSRQLFPAEAGGLYTINASRNLVELVSSWGGDLGDSEVFSPEDCWGLRLGRLHAFERDGAPTESQVDSLTIRCNHVRAPGPESYVCVPLVAQGEAIGLLHIRCLPKPDGPPAGGWLSPERQQLARSAGHRVGLALANLILRDKLRQQSIRDALTGLYNRRYLEESLERELHRALRGNRAVGIIMIDIDHFKRFNDANGHDAGDAVLRELGAVLRPKIRAEDIACRYGGEEFALVMPDASLEITRQRAETLCEDVRKLNVVFNGRSLGAVTISAGVACFPDHGATVEAVISAADAALYCAKRAGRDRVVVAGHSASPQTE